MEHRRLISDRHPMGRNEIVKVSQTQAEQRTDKASGDKEGGEKQRGAKEGIGHHRKQNSTCGTASQKDASAADSIAEIT